LTEPLSLAEKLAINVAGLVMTIGGPGIGGGVGVGVELTTLTLPTMPQHPPCGVQ
jgi:hypothetical protein